MGPVTQEGTGHEPPGTQPPGESEPPDEFAHLFRPDPAPTSEDSGEWEPASIEPSDEWEPLVAIPQAGAEATPLGGLRLDDPPLPDGASAAPEEGAVGVVSERVKVDVPADPKEGRLFRSRGAPERDDTITAIGSMQARRLRTLARVDEPQAPAAPEPVVEQEPRQSAARANPVLPIASGGEPAPALQVMAGSDRTLEASAQPSRVSRRERKVARERPSSGSLTALGVYAVTIGVTVILAFGETLFFGGEPGVITGIGLLVVSVFAAFAVRTNDGIHAIFAPPIAFLVACLTAGQVGITATGLTGRVVVVFFLLGGNWIWIVGSTAAALVIVALRRRVG